MKQSGQANLWVCLVLLVSGLTLVITAVRMSASWIFVALGIAAVACAVRLSTSAANRDKR